MSDNTSQRTFTVGVIGCGNIAKGYAETLRPHSFIRLAGGADLDPQRAVDFAATHGGKAYPSVEAMLDDPEIDLVINLTIHHAHVEVTTKALNAGKHVFSEKPLALTFAEARGLVELAESKNLRLGCAPVTFMGESQQTAYKLIREGRLGKTRVAYAEVNWARIEKWHPNPVPFYQVGPLFDVGVYPLTVLTTAFGPARRVTAYGTVLYPDRVTLDGTPFHLDTPDFVVSMIEHEDGTLTRLTTNFYVPQAPNRQHGIEIHGDAGSMYMGSWFDFSGSIEVGDYGQDYQPVDLVAAPFKGVEWTRGVVDLLMAVAEDRPHRATGSQAAHVVEIMEAARTSYQRGGSVEVTSRFTPPAPMPWAIG